MEPTDRELLDAHRRGDPTAFETLYRRHSAWVAGLARRVCGNREDALDVLQETFIYVAKRADTLDLKAGFRTFLYPVVKHRSIDKKRARKTLPEGPEPEAPRTVEGAIEGYLNQLNEDHREIISMRFADGMSLEEIAGALEIPIGTVKSRLHHALQVLRRKTPNP